MLPFPLWVYSLPGSVPSVTAVSGNDDVPTAANVLQPVSETAVTHVPLSYNLTFFMNLSPLSKYHAFADYRNRI